jgi:ribosomal protein S27E
MTRKTNTILIGLLGTILMGLATWVIKNKRMYFQTEIVKGECPTCNQITTLVGVSSQFYRCMECGGDLEQHINGKISYLPIMSKRDDGGIPFVKEWK